MEKYIHTIHSHFKNVVKKEQEKNGDMAEFSTKNLIHSQFPQCGAGRTF